MTHKYFLIICGLFQFNLIYASEFHFIEEPIESQDKLLACSGSQNQAIQQAHQLLSNRMQNLVGPNGIDTYDLRRLKENYIEPEQRIPTANFSNPEQTYSEFHTRVRDNLMRMNRKIQSGYPYLCSSNSDRICNGNDGTYAYVNFRGNTPVNAINLCRLFFQANPNQRAETLLHELSHLGASTDHFMGSIFNPSGMIESSNDAYLYGKMMHGDLGHVLKMNSWGLMWKKPPTPELELFAL